MELLEGDAARQARSGAIPAPKSIDDAVQIANGFAAAHEKGSVETTNAILKEDRPELSASGAQVLPAIDRIIRRCLERIAPSESRMPAISASQGLR
jgi:hypothetical protein